MLDAIRHLVPWIVLRMSISASLLLKCVSRQLDRKRHLLLRECFAQILLKLVQHFDDDESVQNALYFVVHESTKDDDHDLALTVCFIVYDIMTLILQKEQFMHDENYKCIVNLVLHMSEAEERFRWYLNGLFKFKDGSTIDEHDEQVSLSDGLRTRFVLNIIYFGLEYSFL